MNQQKIHKQDAVELLLGELLNAEAKHAFWPDDKIHQVAIMVEEAGEAMQAAIQYEYEDGSIENIRTELIQTGAMVLRALINLKE